MDPLACPIGRSTQPLSWPHIAVEPLHLPPGEGTCRYANEHLICVSLSPRPVRLTQVRENTTYSGLYSSGDISITAAAVPLFARWDQPDRYLLIRLDRHLLQTVAADTFNQDPAQLQLISRFKVRDPQIESIGKLLLAESIQPSSGEGLYIDSLTNALAVHLLRQYASFGCSPQTACPRSGGLPQHQLVQVLDYLHSHLDQPVKLADLANLVGISQFHFSHLFKQAMGVAPYRYLQQQRIERAKQLLQTKQPITEIALACGFSSHSHLSKQFRQYTGITPSAYRTQGARSSLIC
jgi:AraC family transcriptional regulator